MARRKGYPNMNKRQKVMKNPRATRMAATTGNKSASDVPNRGWRVMDFAAPTDEEWKPLKLPTMDDSMVGIEQKLLALAWVVIKGHSLAIWTQVPPEENAILQMESLGDKIGIVMYQGWKRGYMVSDVDWDSLPDDVSDEHPCYFELLKIAQTLNTIYKRNDITAAQARWFHNERPRLMPLVDAVQRVEAAERDFLDERKPLHKLQLAELAIIRTVVRVSNAKVQEVMLRLRKCERKDLQHLNRSIDRSSLILRERENHLKHTMGI